MFCESCFKYKSLENVIKCEECKRFWCEDCLKVKPLITSIYLKTKRKYICRWCIKECRCCITQT